MYQIKQTPEDFIVNEITNIKLSKKGEYFIFLLKKKDYTTEKTIQTIAEKLNIPRRFIGYAGNKDKKAITTQYISIKNAGINELSLKDIELKLKGYSDKPISLGDLEANEFIINVISGKEYKKLTKIVNYFGEQRFSKDNKEIGKAIIKKDFKKAVESVIQHEHDYEATCKKYLSCNKTDYIGSLRKIPQKILQMYIHSYQSYIWNKMAEETAKISKENIKIPIIGFGTKPDKDIDKILREEGITLRDFIIRPIPELTQEGSERDLFVDIKDLKIEKVKEGYKIKFKLQKGAYATEAIKQMFS